MRPFIERYPRFLRESPEFRDIQEALEPELLELWTARDSALDQLCVETASWGLRYWERTLGLPAEAGKDLEARRSRVRSRLMGADVSAVSLVESVAEIYAGLPAKVEEHPERFWADVFFDEAGGVPRNREGLTEALREIMPAHLSWGFRVSMEAEAPLCLGGRLASQVTLPVPEAADSFRFEGRAGIGGKFALVAKFPVLGIA